MTTQRTARSEEVELAILPGGMETLTEITRDHQEREEEARVRLVVEELEMRGLLAQEDRGLALMEEEQWEEVEVPVVEVELEELEVEECQDVTTDCTVALVTECVRVTV